MKLQSDKAGGTPQTHSSQREFHTGHFSPIERHRDAEREHWRHQRKTANRLNHITACGLVIAFISAIGVVGSLLLTSRSLIIAKQAVDDSRKATIAANRAWVSPINAYFDHWPSRTNDDVGITIILQNTGKEPASDATRSWIMQWYGISFDRDIVDKDNATFSDDCLKSNQFSGIKDVYFPMAQPHQYERIPRDWIDWDFIYGIKYVVVRSCIAYNTFSSLHHTSVCYYIAPGIMNERSLAACKNGNIAD